MRFSQPSRRLILATGIAALIGLAGQTASAANLNWEPDGTVGAPTGGTGTWDTTSSLWDNAGSLQVWNNAANDTAVFSFSGTALPPYTVTLGSAITAGGLTFNASNYTLTGTGPLTLAGTPIVNVVNSGSVARINTVIAGTSGFSTAGSGTLILGGANTFTGVLNIGAGSYVGLTNAAALGSNATGNYTNVVSGGTLNIGGLNIANNPAPASPGEEIRIAGTGVNGIGALINTSGGNTNALGKVVLTADATVSAGNGSVASYNAAGSIITSVGGRTDIRLSGTPTAGQKHLDLANFTLTKTGGHSLILVNADVSSGNIAVNEGQFGMEAGTLLTGAADGSNGVIAVNPNGKLSFYAISAAANVTRPIIINGGTVGELYGTSAAETINSPIFLQGSQSPNFSATVATGLTLAGVISEGQLANALPGVTQSNFSGAEVAKRGAGLLTFGNSSNSYSVPTTVYAGTLRANYTSTLAAGGVGTAAPLTTSDTPLGSAASINLKGGTLSLRINMANDNSNQRWALGKSITVDLAPSAMDFDRLSNATQTDKSVVVSSLTFAPSSASNGWSIGQNQLTFSQGNTHRLELGGVTMNNDTVLNAGDFIVNGDILAAGKQSLVHTGGSSWGFIGGTTQQFNAVFNIGSANLRIGDMYGTGVTNTTITAGTGTIYNGPNNIVNLKAATNVAAGQTIDLVSQRVLQAAINLQFNTLPGSIRAAGTGVISIGGANAFGDIDLARLGDGTFRIGANLGGSGGGTITGVVSPGAGNLVRLGVGGTGGSLTLTGNNRIATGAGLEVGSDLINGGFRQVNSGASQSGVAILTGANDYTGGTIVNRGSILRFQTGTPGTGPITAFGTVTAEGSTGTFIRSGANLPVSIYGGSTIRFDSTALTTAVDVDRWDNSTPVPLINSTLQLDARNNNSVSNETVGAISYSGGNTISLQRNNAGAGQIVQLQTSSLTRANGGTLEVTRSGNSGFGDTVKFLPGTAPAVTNGMVTPTINTLDASSFTNFANFDANGIKNAALTGTITTGATAGFVDTGLLATGIYYLDFNSANTTLTLADNPTVYALKVGGGTASTTVATSGTNNTVTLRSGGLIFSPHSAGFSTDGTRTVTFNPNLVANNGTANIEAVINTRNAFTANLNGTVTADGLTKFGAGTLNFFANSANTLSGNVYINQGTVQSFGPTATSTYDTLGKGLITLAGGQLNLRSNNSAVTGTINQTLENGLSVAQNIPIATLDVGRSGGDVGATPSTGTFIFNPATANSVGLQLLGSAGVQGQTLTISGANTYGVQFGDNALNSLAGNTTINTAVTTRLNNPPTITGTNPVFTKAGTGQLILGSDNSLLSGTATAGTQAVLNGGTLDLRSLTAVGTGATTTLVLNAGTLNLRRDVANSEARTFGGAVAYPVVVNGSSTISADRIGTTANLIQFGLGRLTVNNDATVTLSSGNNYGLDFAGAQINGTAFINSGFGGANIEHSVRFLAGSDISGGALVKTGGGHIHLLNPNSTFDGGVVVQQGILRLRAAGAAGTGTVVVNPGAVLDLNSNANLNAGQKLVVRSNSSNLTIVSVNVNGVTHPTGASVEFNPNETGIVGLSNGNTLYDNPIDLAAIYGGRWSLGGVSQSAYDPRYTAATLGAGADNLYRLGGGGTSMYISISNTAGAVRNNLLTGNNSVRLGFDSGNILGNNGTNYQYVIGGTQNYTGNTVIHRGMVARAVTAPTAAGESVFSKGSVDLFGTLMLTSFASLQNGGVATNALTLHPGAHLQLDNNAAALGAVQNVADRIADGQPIALSGALVELIGNNNNASSETIGDTTFSRGARLRVARNGTGSATLTLNSLTAGSSKGNQLLLQTSGGGTLGGVDKIVVTNSAPTPVNGMLGANIMNLTDNTFVTYGANGFANITYDKTLSAAYTAGSLLATDKVDVTTGAMTLADNPTVYALRTNQSINIGGPYNQLTIRSGGLINLTNTTTIQPNLVFNDGSQNVEARILASSTVNINGSITADGVVKSGNGQLIINVPQANYASGWVVNSGDLIFNDLNAAGQSVAGNAITLNATPTTGGGLQQQSLNATRVVFQRDNGTAEQMTFSGGPIKVVNEGAIAVIASNDRQTQIPNVTTESTGAASSAAVSLDVRSSRFRAIIPTLTLNSDTTARVYDSTNGNVGFWTSASVGSLVGNGKSLNKIGNRTLELTGDNTGTFIGGKINIAAGALRVLNNGALGNATSSTNIERNAALEIGVANFSPAGTLTQQSGSIERWNVEDARGTGNYSLPAGVNLQLNTNLTSATPRTITLNGGSIEGFLYADSVAAANQRNVGSAVTLNLGTDSFVGQNILNGVTYEAGRGPTVAQPFGDNITGSYLRIEGKITGAGNLTKTGLDTVTIASTGNTYGNTSVDMGVLRIAANNALPTSKTLTTRLGGTFDLYGSDQEVAGLGVVDGGTNPGGVSVGSSGRIINSATADNVLKVNNSASFTYNGTIERNVALTKSGSGTLTLGANNTYIGNTMVESGTLAVTGSIAGSRNVVVQSAGTLAGTGTLGLALDISGKIAPGVGGIGTLTTPGLADFKTGSTLSLEIGGAGSFDKLVAGSVSLGGTVTLNLALTGGFTPANNASFLLVDNTGAGAFTGLFSAPGGAVLAEGSVFTVGSQPFSVSYQGGTGNDLVVTAVPEPGVAASLIGGVGLLLGLRRRRNAAR